MKKNKLPRALGGRGCVLLSCCFLLGCGEDPFEGEDLDDPSYPALYRLKFPTQKQPDVLFDSASSIEQSINASRQQELSLHQQIWQEAGQQQETQTPIERCITLAEQSKRPPSDEIAEHRQLLEEARKQGNRQTSIANSVP
jgi:putative alpha-1,2-mannosidase